MNTILLVFLLILLLISLGIELTRLLKERSALPEPMRQALKKNEENAALLEQALREEVGRNREESARSDRAAREELSLALKNVADSINRQLAALTRNSAEASDRMRETLEQRLRTIQKENNEQLDKMRQTVDEKLQSTLEKRLGESFRQVSERLEQVHQGLGEMQTLATGVGDLKKVLTNVKTRGTWGEVQLGVMLEQALSPAQYAANVSTRGGSERVEFAIRLPGRREARTEENVWLPIDAKFPMEDYQRLVEAQEAGDTAACEAASKQLEIRIKNCARDIERKYIGPPATTDFAILFLPTEGLFAEVVRRSGLTDTLQREHRVVVAGPTTLWALLNSLQMGFRTLAIQQRSSEVWELLAAVKEEWTKYGAILEKVHKKLGEASHTIEEAQRKTRTIGRKLRHVESMPAASASHELLPGLPENEDEPEES